MTRASVLHYEICTNRRAAAQWPATLLMFATCAVLSGACAPAGTRFEVLSFKDARGEERFAESFPMGAYAVTPLKNFTMTFQLRPQTRLAGTEQLFKEDPDTSQIVRIEAFWKPRPGTTYAERSQTNANISYCLISGKHAITYEGAGFVYFTRSWDGNMLTGDIESATLVPVHFLGEPNDLFGPCHLRGHFTAKEDRRAVTEAEQILKRNRPPTVDRK